MKDLHAYKTSEDDELAFPVNSTFFTFKTPAMDFINDFNHVKPLAIESTIRADELKSMMMNLHVNLVSIVNSDYHFIGIVDLDDLSDQRMLLKQAEGFARKDILASDVMTPRESLLALDITEIEEASIEDVIAILKANSRKECLVLDRGSHKIRGILTISDISKKLKKPIEIRDKANFYRFFSPISYASRV